MMGDMADYYRDFEDDFYDESYEEMTWVTREGKEIKIKDMSFKHLVNTAKMLKRQGLARTYEYLRIKDEISNYYKK